MFRAMGDRDFRKFIQKRERKGLISTVEDSFGQVNKTLRHGQHQEDGR